VKFGPDETQQRSYDHFTPHWNAKPVNLLEYAHDGDDLAPCTVVGALTWLAVPSLVGDGTAAYTFAR
jgi:hypothetical protein